MSDGSLDGFAAVFESCFDQVYGYVAYRLVPDLDVASDLTQDVFLAALGAWGSFRGQASALTWLRSIARRKIADHYTDQARQGRRQDCPEAPADPASEPSEPQHRTLLLAEAMRLLPADCVELLEGKYLEGQSIRQLAGQLGKSEKAIESALSRARQMLREEYLKLQHRESIL
jgi:RNA polymerase sigma-70 factor (ECF subfamily)